MSEPTTLAFVVGGAVLWAVLFFARRPNLALSVALSVGGSLYLSHKLPAETALAVFGPLAGLALARSILRGLRAATGDEGDEGEDGVT